MKMVITFKGGAQVRVDATDFTSGRNPVTDQLTSLKWTTPDGWTAKLHTIEVDEIVAIHAEREPGESESEASE